MEDMVIDLHFWQGKKVLITGHTGFKGSWLSLWLQQLNVDLVGLSLAPVTTPNLYQVAEIAEGMESIIGDIRDLSLMKRVLQQHQPDIVIHMAAQALVRYSYHNPIETYQTNLMGTMNVLEAIRSCDSVKAAVMVTTDKCYDNKESDKPYQENDALGGYDPYSSSKACAEILIGSYRQSFFSDKNSAAIASVRAGNVIAGGDWSNDRLIPDIVQARDSQTPLKIRNPESIRPWQHVLEPLQGYLLLAEKLVIQGHDYAQAWNFGPAEEDQKQVKRVVEYFAQRWPTFAWKKEENIQPHEASILKLDCTKANKLLDWQPKWSLNETLDKIENWYSQFEQGGNMKQVCFTQIEQFLADKDKQ